MDKWEYKTYYIETSGFSGGKVDMKSLDETLNSYGWDGWELVNILTTHEGAGMTRDVVAIFKRKNKF